MPGSHYVQMDSNGKLDYTFDLRQLGWLPSDDRITAATWTAPDGVLNITASSFTDTQITVWITTTGATENEIYRARCHFTSQEGRQDDRTLFVIIREM